MAEVDRSTPRGFIIDAGKSRFHFFSREGTEPPHIHVRKGDAIAKIWLQPVVIDFSEGFNPSELRRMRELTFEHQTEFVERWNEHFGQ